jgi:AcrR family transcriptional regulator
MAQHPAMIRSRRRGRELEDALYAATLEELTAVGYGGLTMEGIAARAHTGKAALYRRWESKHDLVLAALRDRLPSLPEPRADRSARYNLLAVFAALSDVMAGRTAYPGVVVMSQLLHEPELRSLYADEVVAPRMEMIDSILHIGVRKGEIDPDALNAFTARTGPALIVQHVLLTGAPPTRRELTRIVDTLVAKPPAASPAD